MYKSYDFLNVMIWYCHINGTLVVGPTNTISTLMPIDFLSSWVPKSDQSWNMIKQYVWNWFDLGFVYLKTLLVFNIINLHMWWRIKYCFDFIQILKTFRDCLTLLTMALKVNHAKNLCLVLYWSIDKSNCCFKSIIFKCIQERFAVWSIQFFQ